jgi:hypothetical protein
MASNTIFSVNRAAKETGKSASTISRAIKSSKMSAIKNEDGSYSIDAAELFRVYPQECAAPSMTHHAPPEEAPRNSREIELLEQMRQQQADTIADLRERLTRAEEEARKAHDRLDLRLEYKPAAEIDTGRELITTPEPEPQQARRRWFWQRKEKAKA